MAEVVRTYTGRVAYFAHEDCWCMWLLSEDAWAEVERLRKAHPGARCWDLFDDGAYAYTIADDVPAVGYSKPCDLARDITKERIKPPPGWPDGWQRLSYETLPDGCRVAVLQLAEGESAMRIQRCGKAPFKTAFPLEEG